LLWDVKANLVKGNTYTPMTKEFLGELSKEETEETLHKWGFGTKMLDPEDVARAVIWLVSDASMDINGVNLPVGCGVP
jgi:chanoclavine-I dehydrogenase